MADPRVVKEALGEVEQALPALRAKQEDSIHQAQSAVEELQRDIQERIEELQRKIEDLATKQRIARSQLESAKIEYQRLIDSGIYDDAGRIPEPNFDRYEAELSGLQMQIEELFEEIESYGVLNMRLEDALSQFMLVANPVQSRLVKTVEAAVPWLRTRQEALEKFEQGGDM